MARRLAAEGLGTMLLSAAVVGSGLMAASLSTDRGLMLLANSVATGAVLFVLIASLAEISGAHFNPVVTLVAVVRREMRSGEALGYLLVQMAGACAGTVLAHAMFAAPLVSSFAASRSGPAQWLSEFVASFGLVLVILLGRGRPPVHLGGLVALYIVAAYWFTASTSFANPALTLARAFTASFAGIRLADVPGFVAAQLAGAGLAAAVSVWLGATHSSLRR